MIKSSKALCVIACALSLSACLEVEDKGNEKVANALAEQTKVLEEQKTSISLSGFVKNLSTGTFAGAAAGADSGSSGGLTTTVIKPSATATVKIGATVSAPVSLVDGAFLIPNLPADSDYELTIHSPTGNFMDRTLFGKTRATTSPGAITQDLGVITVAKGVEYNFSIINSSTNLPISTLVLHANSTLGTGANLERSLHTSTYNTVTQQYKITLPELMNLDVYASLDINNDGKLDFVPESSAYGTGATLLIDSAYVNNANSIYLADLNLSGKVKIRLSLLDAALKPILNAKPTINDAMNGFITAIYDATTEQYVFDATMVNEIQVMIPAVTSGTTNYSSSTVLIDKVADTGGLNYTVSTAQSFNASVKFAKDEAKIFNIVQQPVALLNPGISVTTTSSTIDAVTQGFKAFYSGPLSIAEGSATLVRKNALHVVRSNESIADDIGPGTTLVELVDEPVAVDVQLSLGNTLLTLTPKAALTSAGSYKYNIGLVTDAVAKTSSDLINDSLDFEIKSPTAFDISEVKLDNFNYYTQSSLIRPTNSAGVPVSYFAQSQAVYALFPLSVKNVKNLVLRKNSITENNFTSINSQDYVVISNGQLFNLSLLTSVSLAVNETLVGSLVGSIAPGAAVSDGSWYSLYLGEFMSDNVPYANNINFSYTLETLDGVQTTGTLTLPVL